MTRFFGHCAGFKWHLGNMTIFSFAFLMDGFIPRKGSKEACLLSNSNRWLMFLVNRFNGEGVQPQPFKAKNLR